MLRRGEDPVNARDAELRLGFSSSLGSLFPVVSPVRVSLLFLVADVQRAARAAHTLSLSLVLYSGTRGWRSLSPPLKTHTRFHLPLELLALRFSSRFHKQALRRESVSSFRLSLSLFHGASGGDGATATEDGPETECTYLRLGSTRTNIFLASCLPTTRNVGGHHVTRRRGIQRRVRNEAETRLSIDRRRSPAGRIGFKLPRDLLARHPRGSLATGPWVRFLRCESATPGSGEGSWRS